MATSYARTLDGAHIAFESVGDGPVDVLIAANNQSIDNVWDEPRMASALRRLAAVSRLILFDRRGLGSSDPLPERRLMTVEESMSDLVAVLDAAGSSRVTVIKTDNAGPALMFVTTFPERVAGLGLVNAYARLAWAPDYPAGIPQDVQAEYFMRLDTLGPADSIEVLAASRAADPLFREWYERAMRSAASPSRAAALFRQELATDARRLLPLVQVPTLVLHSAENAYISPELSRYIADRIAGARFVLLPGTGHTLAAIDVDALVDELIEFITGDRPRPRITRVLATVLITDIVESTPLAAHLGDADWRALLDQHDAAVHRQLDRFGGHLVKTTGDGIIATFDGPARAIDCAAAIRAAVTRLGLQLRIGLHTGEIELRGEDVSGIAVHVAARVQSQAAPGEVLVSRTVVDLVAGSGIAFQDRGDHELKGVPGPWRLFAVSTS